MGVKSELRAMYRVEMERVAALETALGDLLHDSQHVDHGCGDIPENCPILRARAVLNKRKGVCKS